MIIISIISWIASALLFAFGFIPKFYGIFNIGCVILIVLAVCAFLFPFALKFTKDKKKLRIALLTVVGVGVLSFTTISILMLKQAYFTPPPETGAQTVIVLGARVINDYPSLTLKRRLDRAAEYLEENPEANCVVTGGQGSDEIYPEGEVMKNYLVKKGIDADRIFAEIESTNTRENFRFSQELIPENSQGTVIVTDNFHQLRARITAKALGMEPIYSLPSKTLPGLLPAYWVRDLCGVPLTWIEENFINKYDKF